MNYLNPMNLFRFFGKLATLFFKAFIKSFNKANEQSTIQVRETLKSFWKSSYSSKFDDSLASRINQAKTATELQALKMNIENEELNNGDKNADMYGYIPSLLITPMYMLKNLFISPAAELQIEQPALVGCLTQVPAPAKQGYESLSNNDKFMLWSRPAEKIVATKEQEANAHELRRAKFACGMR